MLSIMTIAHLHMKLKSATMTTNPQNAKIKKLKSVPHSPILGNACLQFVSDSTDSKNPCYYKKITPSKQFRRGDAITFLKTISRS